MEQVWTENWISTLGGGGHTHQDSTFLDC